MSANAKNNGRFLLAPLLLVILFTFGCASTKTIPYIPYTQAQGNEPWFAEAGPKVFIHEFNNETAGEISHGFDKSVEVSKKVDEQFLRGTYLPYVSRAIIPKDIFPVNWENIRIERPSVGLLVA